MREVRCEWLTECKDKHRGLEQAREYKQNELKPFDNLSWFDNWWLKTDSFVRDSGPKLSNDIMWYDLSANTFNLEKNPHNIDDDMINSTVYTSLNINYHT